ncbi:MAG: AMP-binding protein [Pseudomonadales bacterium]|nr:AMP-binding protein [Pseudomonadales bacterium]
MSYREVLQASLRDPSAFWLERARAIHWSKTPTRAFDQDAHGIAHWFPDGELNTAWLCLDAHVEAGHGDRVALIHDSPVTGRTTHLTYAELTERVARFAGGLRDLGVGPGDRVIVYMPMVPEALIAMLACARIGAVHSVVFGGFAPRELALRIDDARPLVLVSASCGIEFDRVIPYGPLVEEALGLAQHPPAHCVILDRPQAPATLRAGRDHDWQQFEARSTPVASVPVPSTHPLYILYTSGTTGRPKGVVRDHGGHAVALRYSMEAIYDVGPGDVFWAASDVGWVVGHSYICYAPLLTGCTSVVYEGKPVRTPDAGAFWRVIAEHGVRVFFVAPTAFRAIRKEDPEAVLRERHDLGCLERLFVAGERCDPPTLSWLEDRLGIPVIDHWWQTETGWPVCAVPAGVEALPTRAGSAGLPMPGYDLRVLDDDGREVPAGESGHLVLALPLPPGTLPTVWGDEDRFRAGYLERFPGYYHTGDGGHQDADGYVFVMGRTDDVINVAGHRLSTGEIEEVVAAHPAIAECAVVGVADRDRGEVPVALVLLKDGSNLDAGTLEAELVARVRHEIGAFANFRRALVVDRLPKTRSGKILRKTLRRLAAGDAVEVPSTIDDPAIVDEIAARMKTAGLLS